MYLFGLHLVDWLVVLVYFAIIVWIGVAMRRRIANTSDYYQGGRSFGKLLTAFLNFGNMTDAGQVAGVSREIYRQGLSGVWFSNIVLFHTPFQWFIAAWQRRARYIGPGDMFLHRYESRFLAGLYATIILLLAAFGNSAGFLLTGKTLQAMMVKSPSAYTVEDRASVDAFKRLQELKGLDPLTLTPPEKAEIATLDQRAKEGEINAFVSYLDLTTFYIVYAVLIGLYTILGGLFAIAIVDVIQGVLILFLSVALIPIGLSAIGGLEGLRSSVPESLTQVFGSGAGSDYTWYYVAALALLNLVVNAPKSFTLGGSPKDDRSARIGFVTGSITKRFVMIGWAFTGLIAVGLYAGVVADPTNIWGYMTNDLLGVGAIGLMIAAIFSANMDGAATGSLDASAGFTKNILLPIVPDASERTQVIVGRVVIAAILIATVFFARGYDDIVKVFIYGLSIGAIVGPAFWMAYFWRRVTTKAVAVQMTLSILITIVAPNVVPAIDSLNSDAPLLAETHDRTFEAEARATESDVAAGLAARPGKLIVKQQRVAPSAIFFEKVAPDSNGVARGSGLFRANVWLLDKVGFDFSGWSAAAIKTAGSIFDAVFPFLILIGVSLVTRRNSEDVLRDFYARIHTPAVADRDEDERLVREKIENPELVERNKLFPGTNIELWKPTRFDLLGLAACIGFVLLIIGLYVLLASIVSP